MQRVLHDFCKDALARSQNLVLKYDDDSATAYVDPEYFGRAVSNLISNAMKYSPDGATIDIKVGTTGDEIVIEVKDTGTGINAEDIPHIFERFYRTDKARNSATGGSGLGLSIVHKIVKNHRGRVEVESEPGRGSVFSLIIPAFNTRS